MLDEKEKKKKIITKMGTINIVSATINEKVHLQEPHDILLASASGGT